MAASGDIARFLSVRGTAIVALLALAAAGCAHSPRASVAQFWNRALIHTAIACVTTPPLHWTKPEETSSEVGQEPKVTANVAVVAPTDADAAGQAVDDAESASGTASVPAPPDRAPIALRPTIDPFIAEGPVSAEAPIDQRMQELKSALTADAEPDLPEIVPSFNSHPLRLRVDGELRRANELLAAGELAEARRKAQLAVDLSEAAALQFLPNEDRPGDLLRQIEERLAATTQAPREHVEGKLSNVGAPRPSLPTGEAAFNLRSSPPTIPITPPVAGEGTVAANVSLAARQRKDAPVGETPIAVTVEIPAVPGSFAELLSRVPSPEAPISLNRDTSWPAAPMEDAAPVPAVAPRPPTVDEIEPVSRDFGTTRPAVPRRAASTERTALHWMDWLPLGVLGLLLCLCGAALGVRRWRHGG
jgi:hypothetical protein